MTDLFLKREQDKVKEISEEYQKKGFDVYINPSLEDLPDFLKNTGFQPDLIARSNSENIIIEVKSTRSIKTAKDLQIISEIVSQQDGWEFLFVLTNPKIVDENDSGLHQNSIEDISEGFSKIKQLLVLDETFCDITFLYLWVLVEAVLRYGAEVSGQTSKTKSLKSLIRDCQVFGIISKTDHNLFMDLISKRNSITHGILNIPITKDEINNLLNSLRRIFDEILRDYVNDENENYILYLKRLSQAELDSLLDSILSEMVYDLENEDSVNSEIALTNAYGWYCDDYYIENIVIDDEQALISFSFHMTGDQDPDKVFHGSDINGSGELVILEDESKYFQNVSAALDRYDDEIEY